MTRIILILLPLSSLAQTRKIDSLTTLHTRVIRLADSCGKVMATDSTRYHPARAAQLRYLSIAYRLRDRIEWARVVWYRNNYASPK